MLTFIEGKVGSGKSYYSVLELVQMMALKKFCVSNIELNPDECLKVLAEQFNRRFKKLPYQYVQEEELDHVHDVVPYGGGKESVWHLTVDEAQNFYNSRDWAKLDARLRRWLSQSRKYGGDVTLVTQHNAGIDATFRRNGSFFYTMKNLSHYPIPVIGSYNGFMRIQKDSQGMVGSVSLRKFKPWVFKCYESVAFLDQETRKLAENAHLVSDADFEEHPSPVKKVYWFIRGLRKLRQGPTESGKGEVDTSTGEHNA